MYNIGGIGIVWLKQTFSCKTPGWGGTCIGTGEQRMCTRAPLPLLQRFSIIAPMKEEKQESMGNLSTGAAHLPSGFMRKSDA